VLFFCALCFAHLALHNALKPRWTTDREEPTAKPALPFAHWRHLHGFADTIATALYRHKRHLRITTTYEEIEAGLWANEENYALLSTLGFGLSFTIAEEAGAVAAAAMGRAVIIMPAFLEFKRLIYFAALRIEADSISVEGNAVHFIGDRPLVVEDGIVIGNEKEGLAERLNGRIQSLRSAENSQQRMVVGLEHTNQEPGMGSISW
jgi:hypothetical protein